MARLREGGTYIKVVLGGSGGQLRRRFGKMEGNVLKKEGWGKEEQSQGIEVCQGL